jgi:two-component system, cell cycle sensor histidine kinase and response regulator CckA
VSRLPGGSRALWAPVVIERAGGGIARIAPGEVPLRALRAVAREGAELVEAERTTVFRLGTAGMPIRCLTRFHRSSRTHEDDVPYADELGREAFRLLERLSILAIEDVKSGPAPTPVLRAYLEEGGVRAMLAVPIRHDGHVAGFLSFEEVEAPRVWSARDREHAATLAYRLERNWARVGRGGLDREAPPIPPEASPGTVLAPSPVRGPVEAPPEPRSEPTSLHLEPPASFGHRRELRARLQRLRTLERTGILGTHAASEALHALHVQSGTLDLLRGRLAPGSFEAELVDDARETLFKASSGLERFLRWTRGGLSTGSTVELNALVGDLAIRLGKLTGDRVGLLYAPSSEPLAIGAEAALLVRSLEELVRNARAASAPGDRVRVAVQRGEEPGGRPLVRLLVEDRGSGIAAADLPWIFEPWFTTRGEGADGMGLPLVQAVVEGHGGWVDVTSTEGQGSRFALNFPLLRPCVAVAPVAEAGEGEAGPDREDRPLALVVEDEPMLARMLRRALEDAGFQVREADGAPGAARLIREHAPAATLVVAERVLPDGAEGMELIRQGRALFPYLGGILLDRRLRTPADDGAVLRRVREGGRIPSDVPLLTAPVDPADLVREARSFVKASSGEGTHLLGEVAEGDAVPTDSGPEEPPPDPSSMDPDLPPPSGTRH